MQNAQNFKDFQEFISLLTPKVQKNIRIVTKQDTQLLHIDIKTPKEFIPMLPRRAAKTEDNTVPRITVADTLLGCIYGYSSAIYEFESQPDIQGYYISSLDFDYALKVNRFLVYDAETTGEHWLVCYNESTKTYKPNKIGKMFFTKTTRTRSNDKLVLQIESEIVIEVFKGCEFKLTTVDALKTGYWRVKINMTKHHNNYKLQRVDDRDIIEINNLTEEEYTSIKGLSASMLSMSSTNIPLSHRW